MTCHRAFAQSRTDENASPGDIKRLREAGLQVENYAIRADCDRLLEILYCREHGVELSFSATAAQIEVAKQNIFTEFRFGVAGEQFRQHAVKSLKIGEPVFFVPEPSNKFDRNAIAITRATGELIGYVKAERGGRSTHTP